MLEKKWKEFATPFVNGTSMAWIQDSKDSGFQGEEPPFFGEYIPFGEQGFQSWNQEVKERESC